MGIRKGYKNTHVGIIPEDWEVIIISDACKLINGRGFKPHEWGTEGFPIIRIQNLNGSEDYNFYLGPYDKKLEIENGQLLFAWSGSRGTSFGPHIWKGGRGLLNYHTWKVEIFESRIVKGYFFHALKKLNKYIEDMAHGASALVHIQKWEMEKLKFPSPSNKHEQTAIATALSDADALISSLEKLIAKKRNIKQGAMQKLLQPKEGWEVRKLGEVLRVRHGKSQKEVLNESGIYPILASGGIIGKSKAFLYDKPSVLIGRKGTIDRPLFMNSPFWSVDTLFYTEIFENFDAKFIYYLFCLIDWYSYNEASGVPSLNAKTIEKIKVSFPSTKSEQTNIANILSDMDSEITALETKLEKYKNIKMGMMQNLLTGRIRLL